MLRYRPTFVHSLVLLWLVTWVLADPLCLLQALMAPQEDSAAYRLVQQGPVGAHVTQHHADVLLNSSTEGSSSRVEDDQSDELGSVDRVDIWRSDRAPLVELTDDLLPNLLLPTSATPRAPPSV